MATRYFMVDESQLRTWMELLGPTACGKALLASACYFFDGEVPDSVKLTAKARTLFEGEKPRLDHRRERAKRSVEKPPASVEKSAAKGKAAKKSQKSCEKTAIKSDPTDALPAETSDNLSSTLILTTPQTPREPSACAYTQPEQFKALAASLRDTGAGSGRRRRRRAVT